jgi:vacuolar protein sorting-associated protein 35
MGLRLNLQTVMCMNELDQERQFEEISYEFASQALVIYQDELSEQEAKITAIKIIAGTFQRLNCFDEDNYDTLITNATQYAAKLLKKPDQCNGVVMCTHMWYNNYLQNEQRIVECLLKAQKLADICVSNPKNVILFVTILNGYLYYIN